MYNEVVTEELLDVAAAWAEAMITNDADSIGSFMADEWVIVSERGVATKEHFLGFVRSGALTHSRFEMRGEARIRTYDDTAVLTARVENTAQFGGAAFEADEWTTDVFVKREGKWLCVLSHITGADDKTGGAEQ
ncbi:MAG: nuclear transport factor 2 family protein [Acidobacteria bacterium]|nr:nuclear transport factor 2 family protein [Acidobacteriota bacterium]